MERVMNGIDLNVFYPDPKIPKIKQRIVTVASADVPRDLIIFKAIAKLVQTYPNILSVIVNKKGGHTERLMQAQFNERIKFFSNLNQDDLRKTYCESEIAVVLHFMKDLIRGTEAMACDSISFKFWRSLT